MRTHPTICMCSEYTWLYQFYSTDGKQTDVVVVRADKDMETWLALSTNVSPCSDTAQSSMWYHSVDNLDLPGNYIIVTPTVPLYRSLSLAIPLSLNIDLSPSIFPSFSRRTPSTLWLSLLKWCSIQPNKFAILLNCSRCLSKRHHHNVYRSSSCCTSWWREQSPICPTPGCDYPRRQVGRITLPTVDVWVFCWWMCWCLSYQQECNQSHPYRRSHEDWYCRHSAQSSCLCRWCREQRMNGFVYSLQTGLTWFIWPSSVFITAPALWSIMPL